MEKTRMSKNSTVTATFLGSPYTAGAFVFSREEGSSWDLIHFSIIDSRTEDPITVTWIESLDQGPIALNEETSKLREEFIDWVEKSKTELPDEA
jgi:hypothetical protein